MRNYKGTFAPGPAHKFTGTTLDTLRTCSFCLRIGHTVRECGIRDQAVHQEGRKFRAYLEQNKPDWMGTAREKDEWREHRRRIRGCCKRCGTQGHLHHRCSKPVFCVRCKSNTHSSFKSMQCRSIRCALAQIQRHECLQRLWQNTEVTDADHLGFLEWYNSQGRPKNSDKIPIIASGKRHFGGLLEGDAQQQNQNQSKRRE